MLFRVPGVEPNFAGTNFFLEDNKYGQTSHKF